MRIVKETWTGGGEVWTLKWMDFYLDRETVSTTPEINSRHRPKSLDPETIVAASE